jgi:PAS domain S-box-containing protein
MVSLLEALPQGREVLIIAPFDEQTLHRWLSGSFICLTGMGMATLFHERRAISASLAKSRQELAASEATFRSLAQSSALMVWISDSQGRLTWINDTWRRFTGSDTPSLHTRHWLKNVPKEDWERIKNIHRVSMATRSPFELEFRLRDARGDLRWMSASSAPRFASDGEFLGYCGSCQDITELKQATQDARDKEHLLRNIFDASGAGIFTLDEDSRLTHANRRMAEMFGIPTERLLGTSYFDLVAPEDEAASRGNYVRLFRGESAEVDRRYQRSDNTCFWGHASVRPIIDEGRFQGIVGTIIDVSAQHEAMEKLNLAAKVFESSNEGVLICDAKNNIVSVNRAFSEITGYQTEEVIGRNPRLFASGRHPVAFYEAMWGALDR